MPELLKYKLITTSLHCKWTIIVSQKDYDAWYATWVNFRASVISFHKKLWTYPSGHTTSFRRRNLVENRLTTSTT